MAPLWYISLELSWLENERIMWCVLSCWLYSSLTCNLYYIGRGGMWGEGTNFTNPLRAESCFLRANPLFANSLLPLPPFLFQVGLLCSSHLIKTRLVRRLRASWCKPLIVFTLLWSWTFRIANRFQKLRHFHVLLQSNFNPTVQIRLELSIWRLL